mmetsp:Transcript_17756/g.32067  ORF Transcript_17756/g.32067 Transcript_17756/m.32067 type:complete len:84 (-) Transcript_17756:258-509(-)|eukprot:CAMPEP_0201609018 /NCGR_PEP_ID=MMETSP0492-20130828/10613_1 /ASSEMBLY_ACC=CAM_ASM_000837 /TAXON_ID=420259 /ORGANISM="Thalassiosira gravida, Strain GMp14c1" /LENGTH=83 /DNA_ID=CAMNT_0048074175 /DNA_START=31 /DNA_END=282 /DNA_ORIENTATION=-
MAEKDVRFEMNSKLMYETLLDKPPRIFRKSVQTNLDNAIADMCGEVVTENDMYEVAKRTTPRPFLQYSLDALDELKTAEICDM